MFSIVRVVPYLHWLKIPERINFKISLLAFKVLCMSALGCVIELVSPATTTSHRQTLRSAESRPSCLNIPARKPLTAFCDRTLNDVHLHIVLKGAIQILYFIIIIIIPTFLLLQLGKIFPDHSFLYRHLESKTE